jgi:hypothetical protein
MNIVFVTYHQQFRLAGSSIGLPVKKQADYQNLGEVAGRKSYLTMKDYGIFTAP